MNRKPTVFLGLLNPNRLKIIPFFEYFLGSAKVSFLVENVV